jgi:hypothetical protein
MKALFFLFNIEFFSGITPGYNFLKMYRGTRVHFSIFVIFIKIKYFPFSASILTFPKILLNTSKLGDSA